MASVKKLPRPDIPGQQEIEVICAEIETRCRDAIVQILKPSLDVVRKLEVIQERLERKVDNHEEMLHAVADLTTSVNDTEKLLEIVKDEQVEVNQRLHGMETSMEKEFQDSHLRENERTKLIRDNVNAIEQQRRENERLWGEAARLQEQHSDEVRKIYGGHDALRTKIEDVQEDLELRSKELHMQLDDLNETLFGESHDRGLVAIKSGIKDIWTFVAPLPATVKSLDETLVTQADVGRRMIACEAAVESGKETMDGFRIYVNQTVDDARGHFEKTANSLVSHHACLMQDLRRQYVDELKVYEQRREENISLHQKTEGFCTDMASHFTTLGKRVEALHQQINAEMHDLQKAQKRSRMSTETELSRVHQTMGAHEASYRRLSSAVEHVASVTGMLIECSQLGNALAIQDFADRRAESWVGPLCDLQRKVAEPITASALGGAPDRDVHSVEKVVMPWREGVARQGYMPGEVIVRDQTFPRRQVLWLHDMLLAKAQGAFHQVPESEVPASPRAPLPRVQEQGAWPPWATDQSLHTVGAAVRDQEPPAGGSEEPPRSLMKGGSRGYDGDRGTPTGRAMGQPGAVGSRGAADGPLGETLPARQFGSKQPSARESSKTEPGVKLPAINLGASGDKIMPKSAR